MIAVMVAFDKRTLERLREMRGNQKKALAGTSHRRPALLHAYYKAIKRIHQSELRTLVIHQQTFCEPVRGRLFSDCCGDLMPVIRSFAAVRHHFIR
jgi:hypothetical protein